MKLQPDHFDTLFINAYAEDWIAVSGEKKHHSLVVSSQGRCSDWGCQSFAELSPILTALGDEKRQSIILELMADKACDGLQVTDLMAASDLSRPAVSHHLKVLKEANLVDFRREGTKNYYYLQHELGEINQLKTLLDQITAVIEKQQ